MEKTIKVLLAIFFAVCIGVHIIGLINHFSSESNLSHVIHLLSYSACLISVWSKGKLWSSTIFLMGAIYPFGYHALCAWNSFQTAHQLNFICILVIAVLPLTTWWISTRNPSK